MTEYWPIDFLHMADRIKLKCSYLHLIRGISAEDLADRFDVDADFVSEAIGAIQKAAENFNGEEETET